jgi:hypothetical protein
MSRTAAATSALTLYRRRIHAVAPPATAPRPVRPAARGSMRFLLTIGSSSPPQHSDAASHCRDQADHMHEAPEKATFSGLLALNYGWSAFAAARDAYRPMPLRRCGKRWPRWRVPNTPTRPLSRRKWLATRATDTTSWCSTRSCSESGQRLAAARIRRWTSKRMNDASSIRRSCRMATYPRRCTRDVSNGAADMDLALPPPGAHSCLE